jgi:hypothetical protein
MTDVCCEIERVISTVEVHSDNDWSPHVLFRVDPDGTRVQVRVMGENDVHRLRPGETLTLRIRVLSPVQPSEEDPK